MPRLYQPLSACQIWATKPWTCHYTTFWENHLETRMVAGCHYQKSSVFGFNCRIRGALILYRVMRQRLSSANARLSPERALEELQKLQHHQIRINQADQPVTGISRLSETQDRVFAALRLKKPAQPQQLALL
jgi:hypothetical protein